MLNRLLSVLLALGLLAGLAGTALAEELEVVQDAGGEMPVLEIDMDDCFDDAQEIPSEVEGDFLPDGVLPEGAFEDIVESAVTATLDGSDKIKPTLTVKYIGPRLYKVYDKTRNYQTSSGEWLLVDENRKKRTLKTTDFELTFATDEATGQLRDSIIISSLRLATFSRANAGDYELQATVLLTGDDASYYDLNDEGNGKYSCPDIVSIPATINKRTVTVTPRDRTYSTSDGKRVTYYISKVYGEKDTFIPFSTSGLLNLTQAEIDAGAKLYTGRLSRKAGEDAGTYRITMGTLDFGNSSYDVVLKSAVYTIRKKPLTDSDITIAAIGNRAYTGKAIEPNVTAKYGAVKLKKGTDYTLSYKNNTAIGTATVTVKGKGNYSGSRKVTFRIIPKATALSGLTAGKKKITVRWKKANGVTGYQIAYSLKSNFSSAKTKTVSSAKTAKLTLSGLKAGKTYYIRIRTYKSVGGKKYPSAWSKSMKIKTK